MNGICGHRSETPTSLVSKISGAASSSSKLPTKKIILKAPQDQISPEAEVRTSTPTTWSGRTKAGAHRFLQSAQRGGAGTAVGGELGRRRARWRDVDDWHARWSPHPPHRWQQPARPLHSMLLPMGCRRHEDRMRKATPTVIWNEGGGRIEWAWSDLREV